MKKLIIFNLVVLLMMPVLSFAFTEETGNGAPSGTHYTLNIIGVQNPKNTNMDDGRANGHVIFVSLTGKTKIELSEAPAFEDIAVLDKDGTDGTAAFQLPAPGFVPYEIGSDTSGMDTEADYSVFVRPLGKPGGGATITTCADIVDGPFSVLLPNKVIKNITAASEGGNEEGELGGYCSLEQVGQLIRFRDTGKSRFENVTAQLLSIVFKVDVDTNDDGVADETVYLRVPIFDSSLENEYWEYDNNNLKLLQVRFYPIPKDVTEADDDLPPL